MKPNSNKKSTEHEKKLFDALIKRGVPAVLAHSDGYKTVDIAILPARIYVEVDDLSHFVDPDRIIRDFKRCHFSDGDDFSTFYVTNQIIDHFLDRVADALAEVVKRKINK